jgi:putative FmdB family regulatory protein
MPLYDYECTDCKKISTVVLSLKEHEKGKVTCPKCGSKKVVQVISAFFAKTDSKT